MSYDNEFTIINNFNEYDLIKYLENGLISRATGGTFDYYDYVRQKILQNKDYEKFLPSWFQTCRDINQFWGFIKKIDGYQPRREFIWNEFTPLFNFLQSKITSPLDEFITFDEGHIHTQWQKALERKISDPEGAITIARTLIESLLKYILDEQGLEYGESIELSELYKEVAKLLNMAPEQHQEQIFKQILGGANGIISGLGSMRNKLGDAHGKTKSSIKPQERHSELAVNLAGTMAIFLFKTYRDKFPNK